MALIELDGELMDELASLNLAFHRPHPGSDPENLRHMASDGELGNLFGP